MDHATLLQLAQSLVSGQLDVDQFAARLAEDDPATGRLDAAALSLDLDRRTRCGFPEVVFGEGKSAESIVGAFRLLQEREDPALATRVSPQQAEDVRRELPAAVYNEVARTLRLASSASVGEKQGRVTVITAGTTDLPIAEEARETLDWMGVEVNLITDVGVAGPHRLPARLAEFRLSDALVVVAGMEGALPSVVGGYVACPVIAVPTSVGYGANFGGVAALLGMLNSCAANVAVVNIDAGFKGAYLAGMIAKRAVGG